MIAKKYRLKEREVKKVLQKGKPFFSYSLVFNTLPNTLPLSRFAIVLSGKSVPNSVARNIYRRKFYDICSHYRDMTLWDIVCVVKAKTDLKKDTASIQKFSEEIQSIFQKTLWKNI